MIWDDIAGDYLALVEDREKIILPALITALEQTGTTTVVDVGGGDGRFLELLCQHFASKSFSALGLTDPSTQMRARARERLASVGPVEIKSSPSDLPQNSWQLVLFVAVWMNLKTEVQCVSVLREIRSLLMHQGRLVAAVTHPCFRDRPFHSYSTSFNMSHYLDAERQFKVSLYDGVRTLEISNSHWSLSDHARQLSAAGFLIESLVELPDVDDKSEGAPWLLIVAKPRPTMDAAELRPEPNPLRIVPQYNARSRIDLVSQPGGKTDGGL